MAENRIITAVRIRPFSLEELKTQRADVTRLGGAKGDIVIVNPSFFESSDQSISKRELSERIFSYDFSFKSKASSVDDPITDQAEIYSSVGKPIVKTCLEGVNCSLFAYGQTGSGKTYTMMGEKTEDAMGIIPRLCRDLLSAVYNGIDNQERLKEDEEGKCFSQKQNSAQVDVGYYEIYNEKIHDLLNVDDEPSLCKIREHSSDGVYVEGLTLMHVEKYEDVANILHQGQQKRATASTLMNAHSSRSHAVFTIFIRQHLVIPLDPQQGDKTVSDNKFKKTTIERRSKVCLIDLAGSERINSTGATGERLKEATKINQSLSTLGDVIRALSESSEKDDKFVPYRNSALTWILKDSLGGNSKTTMLATISPIDASYSESMNTLRYVERAKLIVNKIVVNDDNSNDPYIKHLQSQVAIYKNKLNAALNKMRHRETEYQEYIQQKQKELDIAQAELKQLKCEDTSPNSSSMTSAGLLVADKEKMESEMLSLQVECTRLNAELNSKCDEVAFALDDLANARAQVTYLNSQLLQVRQDNDHKCECLMNDIKELERDLNSCRDLTNSPSSENDEGMSQKYERLQLSLSAKMEDYDELCSSMEELEANEDRLKSEVEDLERQLKESKAEGNAMQDKLSMILGEKYDQESSMIEMVDTLHGLMHDKDEHIQSLSVQLNDMQELRRKKEDMESKLRAADQAMSERNEQIKALSKKLESASLESAEENHNPEPTKDISDPTDLGELAILKILNKDKENNISETQQEIKRLHHELDIFKSRHEEALQKLKRAEKSLLDKDSEIDFLSNRHCEAMDEQVRLVTTKTNEIASLQQSLQQKYYEVDKRDEIIQDLKAEIVALQQREELLKQTASSAKGEADLIELIKSQVVELSDAIQGKQNSIDALEDTLNKTEISLAKTLAENNQQSCLIEKYKESLELERSIIRANLSKVEEEKEWRAREGRLGEQVAGLEKLVAEKTAEASGQQQASRDLERKLEECRGSMSQERQEWQREKEQLEASEGRLREEVEALRGAVASEESRRATLSDALREAEERAESSRREAGEVVAREQLLQAEVGRLEGRVKEKDEEAVRLGEALQSAEQEANSLCAEVSELEAEVARQKDELLELERLRSSDSAEAATRLFELEEEKKEWRAREGRLGEQVAGLEKLVAEKTAEASGQQQASRDLERKLEECRGSMSDLKGELEAKEQERQEWQREKEQLEASEGRLREEVEALRGAVASEESRRATLSDALREAEERAESSRREAGEVVAREQLLQAEVDRLEGRVKEKDEEAVRLGEALQSAEQEANSLCAEVSELEAEVARQKDELLELERLRSSDSAEAATRLFELEEEKKEWRAREGRLGEQVAGLEKLVAEKTAEASGQQQASRDLERKLEECRGSMSDLKGELEAKEQERQEWQREKEQLEASEGRLREEVEALRGAVASEESRRATLSDALREAEERAESSRREAGEVVAREQLLQAEVDRLEGRVKEKDEEAVRLGEALQSAEQEANSLCAEVSELEAEVARQKDELLELERLRSSDSAEAATRLFELEEEKKEWRAREGRLGEQVAGLEKLVAEKTAEASGQQQASRDLERKLEECRGSMSDLKGELEAKEQERQEWQREKEQLEASEGRLREEVEALRGAVASEESRRATLSDALREAEERAESSRREAGEVVAREQLLQAEVGRLEGRVKEKDEEAVRLGEALQSAEQEANSLCAEVSELEAEVARQKDELLELERLRSSDSAEAATRLFELEEEKKEWRAREGRLGEQVAGLEKLVAEKTAEASGQQQASRDLERKLEECRGSMSDLKGELEAKEQERQEWQREKEQLEASEGRLREEVEALRGAVASEESRRATLSDALREAEERAESSRREAGEVVAREQLLQAEVGRLEGRVKEKDEEAVRLGEALQSAEQEANSLCAEVSELEAEVARQKDELLELERLRSSDSAEAATRLFELEEEKKEWRAREGRLGEQVAGLEKLVAEKTAEASGQQQASRDLERKLEECGREVLNLKDRSLALDEQVRIEQEKVESALSVANIEYHKLQESHKVEIDKLNISMEEKAREFQRSEEYFVQYKTKAFSTIEGLQNEIDILNRKLYLPGHQEDSTIDLVKTTKEDLQPRYVGMELSPKEVAHSQDSLADELISAKVQLAELSNEISELKRANVALKRELETKKKSWNMFK